jgi:pyruvate/2-oxoglutarate dehydrogenase complex dihydrolipoamide acyltransferase (E2) component
MSLRNVIHKDARIALSRTQGRRAASWLIMAACLGVMMLLWGVPLPGWAFGIIVAVPFVALFALGNYWAGVDELAAAKAARKPAAKAAPKTAAKSAAKTTARPAATPGAKPGARPAVRRSAKARSKRHH